MCYYEVAICLLQKEQGNRRRKRREQTQNCPNICSWQIGDGPTSQGSLTTGADWPCAFNDRSSKASPRPERPESTNPRPEAETSNIRPNADESSRPNPSGSGRSETDITRPERPLSRCQPIRWVSPFTDWSSLSDNDDVISVHRDGRDANYVPMLPVYEPESPGPQERDNSRNRDSDRDSNERPRSLPLAEEHFFKGFPLSLGELAKGENMILER